MKIKIDSAVRTDDDMGLKNKRRACVNSITNALCCMSTQINKMLNIHI